MQCHNCNHTIAIWHSYCPHCQQRIQPVAYSTISDAPKESLEDHSRRKLLRTVLQFAFFAIAIIVVATAIRWSLPKPNEVKKETVALQPTTSATIAPTEIPASVTEPSTATIAPSIAPTVTPSEQPAAMRPINILSPSDLARISTPVAPVRQLPQPAAETIAKPTVAATLPTKTPIVKVDEALPKNLAKITKETSAPPRPIVPPPPMEPSLELETGSVSLHPNTGLLSIKSYVPARVYIDGVFSGVTPRSVKLLAGEHVVTLLADGYQEYARKVKVKGQQQMGILASMSKK